MGSPKQLHRRPSARGTALAVLLFGVAAMLVMVDSLPLWLRLGGVGLGAAALLVQGSRIRASMDVAWEVDDEGITYLESGTLSAQVLFAELIAVSIMKTEDGWSQDFFFLLHDEQGEQLAVPLDRAAEIGLLTRLQSLEGFDPRVVAEASASAGPVELLVWEREPIP